MPVPAPKKWLVFKTAQRCSISGVCEDQLRVGDNGESVFICREGFHSPLAIEDELQELLAFHRRELGRKLDSLLVAEAIEIGFSSFLDPLFAASFKRNWRMVRIWQGEHPIEAITVGDEKLPIDII